jgi:hypothetical protein
MPESHFEGPSGEVRSMSESTNNADGAYEGWMQSSTCRDVDAAGRTAGREYGLAESMSRTLAVLLSRQARQKFGGPDETGRTTLDGLARAFATEPLGELGERLVDASSWDEWLAGIVVPPPAPDRPDYTRDLEIDLEPSVPSIDSYLQVTLRDGATMICHIRIQKWYQPDLDRHLFENSRKVERKHGKMPMVAVFLMWPPAEGPDMTGRFEECDADGRVQRTFTYTIHRAWEMSPEEVTRSPGTMMLAPLTMNARERMPEIVQMIEDGLNRYQADAETRAKAWVAAYWNMGLICDLDAAHRALGDVLAFIQATKDYQDAKGHAFLEACSAAQREGRRQAGRDLIQRQATRRFGPDPDAAAAITAVAEPDELDAIAERVLTAADWASLLARS